MATNSKRPERNPILGIDFAHDQIRVVEVRRDGREFLVTKAGSVSIPAGSLEPGSHVGPQMVGQRLKTLLKRLDLNARHAVFGIPSSGVFTRLLDIPMIPDDELQSVVRGEVAHYQMVREDGGAFGFSKVATPENARELQVLVMAADDPVLHYLEDVAKEAGIQLSSREPSQLSAMRAGVPRDLTDTTLFISIEESSSEIAILDGGKLALYRRIDVGGRNLMAHALANMAEAAPAAFSPSMPIQVDEVLSARLATEVRRSVEFFRRQFPTAEVYRAHLSIMDPRLEGMAGYLGGSLGVDCTIAQSAIPASAIAATETGIPVGPEWLAAIGLAAGELGYVGDMLPRFELEPSVERPTAYSGGQARWGVSIAATILVAAAGLYMWNSEKSKADGFEARIAVLKVENDKLAKEIAPKQKRRDMEYKVLADLTRQGVPFPWVMDEFHASLDPGVGLSEIKFDGGRLRVQGDAITEAALITTLDRLRDRQTFRSTFVDQFQNDDGKGLKFNLSSEFVSEKPKPAPEAGQ